MVVPDQQPYTPKPSAWAILYTRAGTWVPRRFPRRGTPSLHRSPTDDATDSRVTAALRSTPRCGLAALARDRAS